MNYYGIATRQEIEQIAKYYREKAKALAKEKGIEL